MRDLRRNQVPFWYSLHLKGEREPVLANGFHTGQYKEKYTEPIQARARISYPTGGAELEMFGADLRYDRVISSVQDLPIDEYSHLWIESDPTTGAPYDYKVSRVAKGLGQNLWAVEKVTRDGDKTN